MAELERPAITWADFEPNGMLSEAGWRKIQRNYGCPGCAEVRVELERVRKVARQAAYHLRNLPATTELSDVRMAEALEAVAGRSEQ